MVRGDAEYTALLDAVSLACLARNGKVMRSIGVIRFCCPVHNDHTPSADFKPEIGAWICRSCNASGGLVTGENPLAPLLGIDTKGSLDHVPRIRQAILPPDPEKERRMAENRTKMADWYSSGVGIQELLSDEDGKTFLAARAISDVAVRMFGLGLVDYQSGGQPCRAVSIPWTDGDRTIGLQYRLLTDDKSKRYRAAEGSRYTLFNWNAFEQPDGNTLIVVEGALKCATVWSTGITDVIAVVNKGGWSTDYWEAVMGSTYRRVVFALDPDATEEAWAAAMQAPRGIKSFVAKFPEKIDDYALRCNGDPDCVLSIINCARRVK